MPLCKNATPLHSATRPDAHFVSLRRDSWCERPVLHRASPDNIQSDQKEIGTGIRSTTPTDASIEASQRCPPGFFRQTLRRKTERPSVQLDLQPNAEELPSVTCQTLERPRAFTLQATFMSNDPPRRIQERAKDLQTSHVSCGPHSNPLETRGEIAQHNSSPTPPPFRNAYSTNDYSPGVPQHTPTQQTKRSSVPHLSPLRQTFQKNR